MIYKLFGLAAASVFLVACQSKNYKVDGDCNILNDGDTLFLTNNFFNGYPSDTAIISDGHFSFEGSADSISLALIYAAKQHDINVPFIVEPGSIDVYLSNDIDSCKTGGEDNNKKWQSLNDSIRIIGKKINKIATILYSSDFNKAEQKEYLAKMDTYNKEFNTLIYSYAKNNIENEFGYFIITYYSDDDIISPKERLKLITLMPEKIQKRNAIVAIKKSLTK